jgi:hypothetical protein
MPFTCQRAEDWRSSPNATLSQVLAATAATMQQGTTAQMPDGEGPMLTETRFGTPAPQRFPARTSILKAGLLQGLNPGDALSLYLTPKVARR